MVDRESVLTRAARVHEMLRVLRALPPVTGEEFARDPDLYLKAERCLEVAAQSVLDIAAHLVAERGLPKPERYGDLFRILGHHGILEAALAGRLERLAGLRNLLVHEYLGIDRARLLEFIRQDLGDVDAFLGVVMQLTRED